ncbi:MAG TPA: C-GCAxxG-C-C family (seleno)protein [Candidatus Deferrimicrobium sp.]|nr:C-GCAxxG-C-C family (seleno)protein [Candidatus Deferrimicrobium sp.]
MTEIEEVERRFKNKLYELSIELPKKYSETKITTYNCAALTMKSFLEILNINDLNLINMAAPLAGITNICGAVNAGLMITGFIAGKKGKKALDQMIAAAEGMKFLKRFKQEFGSIHCQDLTGGYNLLTVEGLDCYLRDKIWEKKCYKHVLIALKIIGIVYTKQISKII